MSNTLKKHFDFTALRPKRHNIFQTRGNKVVQLVNTKAQRYEIIDKRNKTLNTSDLGNDFIHFTMDNQNKDDVKGNFIYINLLYRKQTENIDRF